MLDNWQILKTETYQVVEWFYVGQLADSEQKHIRWLDNWQILNKNISGGWMVLYWETGRF